MGYELVKLKEVATYVNGKPFKPTEWETEGKPIIRIQNLNNKAKPYNYTTKEFNKKYLIKKGDILISWSASLGIFEWEDEDAWLNQHIFKVVFDGLEIDKNYFKLAISNVLEHMKSLVHGATMKHITKVKFDNIEIPLPPMDIQIKIANALDKAQELVDNRKAQIGKYDELLQSVFLDMFGDPVSNPKGWEVKKSKEIISKIIGGLSLEGEERKITSEELGVLKISAVTTGKFNPNKYKVVDKNQITKELVFPKNGDLLFSRANTPELVGATCIVDKTIENLFLPDKLWKIILIENQCDKFYYKFLLSNKGFKYNLEKVATGTNGSMLNISKTKLLDLQIPLPPLKLQNQFASIVEKVEMEKKKMGDSLVELENNFNSIMQRAFRGELF